MSRSKQKKKLPEDEENDNLSVVNMFKELKEDIQDLKDNNEEVKKILQDDIKLTRNRVTELEQKYDTHQTQLTKMNETVTALQKKLIKQEMYIRRNNLIFEGIEYKEDENCVSKVRRIMIEILKIEDTLNISLDKCHRLYKSTNPARPPTPSSADSLNMQIETLFGTAGMT
jgi:chromosome segregation ATPase